MKKLLKTCLSFLFVFSMCLTLPVSVYAQESVEENTVTQQAKNDSDYLTDPIDMSLCTITLSQTSYTYNGQEQKPDVTVYYGNMPLAEGNDYSLFYTDDINAGTAKVTVTGITMHNCYGSNSATYTITPAPATVTVNQAQKIYMEEDPEFSAEVTGLYGQDTVDYTFEREAGEDVGVYKVYAKGEQYQGNYNVTYVENDLQILPMTLAGLEITCEDAYYNGKEQKQVPVITYGDKQLVAGKDFEVTYNSEDLINPGTVNISISGLKNYSGSIEDSYDIVVEPVKITSVYNGKDSVEIKWNAVEGATGYILTIEDEEGNMDLQKTEEPYYIDTNVESGKTYTYEIITYNESCHNYSKETTLKNTYIAEQEFKAINYSGCVWLSWDNVAGAKEFVIYRKVTGSWKEIGRSDGYGYTDQSAVAGKKYTYAIQAVNGDAKSGYAYNNQTVFYGPVLSDISNVSSGVKITWNAVAGATKYAVYRRTFDGDWSKYLTKNVTSTSYIDTTAESGTTYFYTVKAYVGGWSDYDVVGVFMTRLTQPVLKSVKNANGGVSVKWTAVEGATSYKVCRKEVGTKSWEAIKVTEETSYLDTTAENGKSYIYTVRAVADLGISSYDKTGVQTTYVQSPKLRMAAVRTKGKGNAVYWYPVSGATKYAVYRRTADGTKWTRLTNTCTSKIDKNQYYYHDTTAESGVAYYYTVRAYNTAWSSYDPVGVCNYYNL